MGFTQTVKWYDCAVTQIFLRLLLVITILLPVQILSGQSYYYFENKLNRVEGSTSTYHTFLTVAPDGSAQARVRYYDTAAAEERLLEIHFVDSIGDNTNDTLNRYLVAAQHPVLIMGTGDEGFILPVFAFTRVTEGTDDFYMPAAMLYKDRPNWQIATPVVNQEKTYEALLMEKQLVSIFFNEADDFFQFLYGDKTRTPTIKRLEKFHLVVVANTNDPIIGVTAKKDLENVVATFTSLTNDLGIPLIATKIEGSGFSKAAVKTAINKLKPAPIDIVVFYYSGHGFRYSNDTSKYPRISLKNNPNQNVDDHNFPIETIYQDLLKKGARVNIVLSDCCNENIGSPVPVGRTILKTRQPIKANLNMANCNALFFPKHPVAILTSAAEAGQLASGNPTLGGFFTSFFNVFLKQSLYGHKPATSWLQLLLTAKEKARWQALTAICGTGRCVQRAAISVVPPQ